MPLNIKGAKESSVDELRKSLGVLAQDKQLIALSKEDAELGIFTVAAPAGLNLVKRREAYAKMQECMKHRIGVDNLAGGQMAKASISTGSNIYGYDLRAPSLHLIPWLSPIRDITARVQHEQPGTAANWKAINASSFNPGGFVADPWVNEGQRAPLITASAQTLTAPYATIGTDGSDTYEAQSAGKDFEDPLATARFLGLESLMVKEEDALIGGNRTLKLGTANTPTGTGGSDIYVQVVGLTYSGVRNQSVTVAGLVGQQSITTPDGKPMQVNGGIGIVSVQSANLNILDLVSVAQKPGEMGWAWYAGTVSGTLHLQAITTVPQWQPPATTGALNTTNQLSSALNATDYSVNDGTTGGGGAQVIAFDGFLTQIINASQLNVPNAYYKSLGTKLTSSGAGGIVEIDDAMQSQWDTFRTTFDKIYVNSRQLRDITKGCLSNSSAPLLRYDLSANGENYDLVASGTVSFYFNPFLPGGGHRIPIIVHPTIPAGTILMQGTQLPPYFKKSNMTNVAEVICRRDYYSVDWADVTREYQFGTYSEEVLAIYAPFALGVLTGILPGITASS